MSYFKYPPPLILWVYEDPYLFLYRWAYMCVSESLLSDD